MSKHLADVLDDVPNRTWYDAAAKNHTDSQVEMALADTLQWERDGKIKTTKARTFRYLLAVQSNKIPPSERRGEARPVPNRGASAPTLKPRPPRKSREPRSNEDLEPIDDEIREMIDRAGLGRKETEDER
jgi:hypothetical protein